MGESEFGRPEEDGQKVISLADETARARARIEARRERERGISRLESPPPPPAWITEAEELARLEAVRDEARASFAVLARDVQSGFPPTAPLWSALHYPALYRSRTECQPMTLLPIKELGSLLEDHQIDKRSRVGGRSWRDLQTTSLAHVVVRVAQSVDRHLVVQELILTPWLKTQPRLLGAIEDSLVQWWGITHPSQVDEYMLAVGQITLSGLTSHLSHQTRCLL